MLQSLTSHQFPSLPPKSIRVALAIRSFQLATCPRKGLDRVGAIAEVLNGAVEEGLFCELRLSACHFPGVLGILMKTITSPGYLAWG